ncbi:hypothetical protein JMJ35_010612 [Cladonia borealis]|uniref:Uncharacterized protein n=1 Tax=Cladonia borealis TaxID=184061 RepID=A0AA39QPU1_9LECA|nr:hypothetical protein JMJ35_010612 [Cladonia borealis]
MTIAELLSTGKAHLAEGLNSAVNYTIQQMSFRLDTMTPERRAEVELKAAMAGLRPEEVPAVALILDKPVEWVARLIFVVSEITLICVHYLWRRLLVGFWPGKLAIWFAWIFWGRARNAGMGRCRLVVGYVAFLLVGPVCELLDTSLVALERWLGDV